MNKVSGILLILLCVLLGIHGEDESDNKSSILGKGGICLLVSPKDLSLAEKIAEKSEMYIQVLQANAERAEKFAFELSKSTFRNKISIRMAEFTSSDYSSNLFNLIIVCGKNQQLKPSADEAIRILTPQGILITEDPVDSLPNQVASIKLSDALFADFKGALVKKNEPLLWAPADSLKWRAGSRAHISVGFMGLVHGSGKFIYRELMEAKDSFPKSSSTIFARDSYNGRTLWKIEEPVDSWSAFRLSQFHRPGYCMALDNNNNFFYITPDQKLVCLDANTGTLKGTLIDNKAGLGNLKIHDDKYLIYRNTVFSTKTLQKLFGIGGNFVAEKNKIFFVSGNTFKCVQLEDGKTIFENKLEWLDPRGSNKYRLEYICGLVLLAQSDKWKRPFDLIAFDPETGVQKWKLDLPGIYSYPARKTKPDDKVFLGVPVLREFENKIIAMSINLGSFYKDHQEGYFTRIDPNTGAIEEQDYGYDAKCFGNNCNNEVRALGDYNYYWHNKWYNMKTKEKVFPYLVHPGCFIETTAANGYIYNVSSRKGGSIEGITAIGPKDIVIDQTVGGSNFYSSGVKPTQKEPTKETDWPMFRHDSARGNFVSSANISDKLKLSWKLEIGNENPSYGIMMERKTGLTAASIAYQKAYVVDIDSNCIVAVDVSSGKIVWQRSLPSRVDFPPTLYNGICLVAGNDGWVYSLDAETGKLIYHISGAPRERYIGGQEKLESLWPIPSDVFVRDGKCFISNGFATNIHGGTRLTSFEAETGKVIWAKCYFAEDVFDGFPGPDHMPGLFVASKESNRLLLNTKEINPETGELNSGNFPAISSLVLRCYKVEDMLSFGNSLGRTNEDRARYLFSNGVVGGRVLSFDSKSSVAYTFTPKEQNFINTGELRIRAFEGKKQIWTTDPIELVVDDIILTPKFIYAAGHYYRTQGQSELLVMSREDGKILNKYAFDEIPAFAGMSLSNDKIFIATRDGKLLCFSKD